MTDIIFSTIKVDLTTAASSPSHPFRLCTFATSTATSPSIRTVVLRAIDQELSMYIYTDRRSKKVMEIGQQNQVSLLFYDPVRKLQITIGATAQCTTDDQLLKKLWATISPKSKKEYMSKLPSREKIQDPEKTEYHKEQHFFTVIKIIPQTIEYLRLKKSNHIRVQFDKEGGNWKGNYITP